MQLKLATFDIETTPFKYGIEPVPFLAVIYTPEFTRTFWGDDCIVKVCSFIQKAMGGYRIYAHNGGKFDYVYLMREGFIQNPLSVINGRIVGGRIGEALIADSLLIYPMSLASYQKDSIDYGLFVKTKREKHRKKITQYCINDCKYLYDIVQNFMQEFGYALTFGQASFRELRKLYQVEKNGERYDKKMRWFYYGGRCQAFKTGKIKGNFKYYDVNSLYPFAMTFNHFNSKKLVVGAGALIDRNGFALHNNPYFAIITCKNRGALCYKDTHGFLNFTKKQGTFHTSGFEIQAGIKYGLITDIEYHKVIVSLKPDNYSKFVNKFYHKKANAKDKLHRQFYKFILNSSYGKFAQDPSKYYDYHIKLKDDPTPLPTEFTLYSDSGEADIYRKPNPEFKYNDVGTGASITAKARAIMIEVIAKATNPIYTDTDSIVCEHLNSDLLHPTDLGKLKLEADNIDTAYIAGKKLYEFYSGGELVGIAGKGFKVQQGDIVELIKNGNLSKKDFIPKFNLGKPTKFITKNLTYSK